MLVAHSVARLRAQRQDETRLVAATSVATPLCAFQPSFVALVVREYRSTTHGLLQAGFLPWKGLTLTVDFGGSDFTKDEKVVQALERLWYCVPSKDLEFSVLL